jgi:hypothetical protein
MKAKINTCAGTRTLLERDDNYKHMYGEHAVVTKLGKINIVHLDNPSKDTIRKRADEIIREEINGDADLDDCPLCRQFKDEPYDVVYYGER